MVRGGDLRSQGLSENDGWEKGCFFFLFLLVGDALVRVICLSSGRYISRRIPYTLIQLILSLKNDGFVVKPFNS